MIRVLVRDLVVRLVWLLMDKYFFFNWGIVFIFCGYGNRKWKEIIFIGRYIIDFVEVVRIISREGFREESFVK